VLQNTNQDQLEAVLLALTDLIFEVSRDGWIRDCRLPDDSRLRVKPEHFLGKRISEVAPGPAARVIMNAIDQAAEHGRYSGARCCLDTQDGPAWFKLSAAAKGEGEPAGRSVVVLLRDITDQKRSVDRYRAIFETTGTATLFFEHDGTITLANEEFAKLAGYPREEIEGKKTWMEFIDVSYLPMMLRYHLLRSTDPDAAPRAYETRVVSRSGRRHDILITISRIPESTQRVASFLDITERKRTETQMFRAEKMASLGQIVAGVAHEINNPNSFIRFNLPILRRYLEAMRPVLDCAKHDDPDLVLLQMPYQDFWADVTRLIETMEHGSQRITDIVSELRAHVKNGEDEEPRPARLDTIIGTVVALIGKQVQSLVRRFDVEIEAGLPPCPMKAGRIEQVLINLLLNAGQAADKEDSRVLLSVRQSQDGRWIELRVADNGCGIPEDALHRIFEPFYTSKSRDAGTGLGLSIAQRILAEHGGRLEVVSHVGEGSTFTACLPVFGPAEKEGRP